MENQKTSLPATAKSWIGESILVKLALIGFLTLLLLIPSSAIQDLIKERQARQNEVTDEISDKWSGSQLVDGPVLVLPYKKIISEKEGGTGKLVHTEVLTNVYILPEVLAIISGVEPEVLHRGIFDAVVYNTKIKAKGKFSALELVKAGINTDMILWDKAKVVIGLSDLKGLKNNPVIKMGTSSYPVEPDFSGFSLFTNNLVAVQDLSKERNTALDFSFDLDLRGSTELSFRHLGKSTNVTVNGRWDNPSFTGRFLPENRSITAKGFTANWKMAYFNRTLPQQWMADNTMLDTKPITEEKTKLNESKDDSTFGVKFILPVDQYQKTMRSAKYAILIILLTFISLFFSELLIKRKVHLLQYILIGAAMIIYYTLLLSLSEQVGFDWAYLIASLATVLLIGIFVAMVLNNRKPALVFGGILTVFYSFIYVVIQLQDLALLFGSIGLFIIVAVMMFMSARIDWNKKEIAVPEG